jgi:mRNA-degrading endonuclease toxin of MazEF toxin-antitoxin module
VLDSVTVVRVEWLERYVTTLSLDRMREVDVALRYALDLDDS